MDEQEADATIRKLGDYILERWSTDRQQQETFRKTIREVVLMTIVEQDRQRELGEIRSFVSACGALGMKVWVNGGKLKFSKEPKLLSDDMRRTLGRIRLPLIQFLTRTQEAEQLWEKRLEGEQNN